MALAGVIVSVCFVAGCFALGCSSRGRGFRYCCRRARAQRLVASLLRSRGFLFFFGGGSGELIATLALSPQIHTFATSLQVPLSRWSVDMWCCVQEYSSSYVRRSHAGTSHKSTSHPSVYYYYYYCHTTQKYGMYRYCTVRIALLNLSLRLNPPRPLFCGLVTGRNQGLPYSPKKKRDEG